MTDASGRTRTISFGVTVSNRAVALGSISAPALVDLAAHAEQTGAFESIWVGDSIIAKPRLEAVALLAAIAVRTRSVRLGTACLATFPLRHPVLFAHQWASLDALSMGRTQLAVCLGGHGPTDLVNAEAGAFGMEPGQRVSRMLEGMDVVRRLWSEDEVTYRGRYVSLDRVSIAPHPDQQPCPIWIANNPTDPRVMERAYRRVAKHGDGWMTGSLPSDVLGERWRWVQQLRQEEHGNSDGFSCAIHLRANVQSDAGSAYAEAKEFLDAYYSTDHSREHLEQECVIGTPEECIDKLVAYGAAGATVIIIRLASWNMDEQLDRWATEVLPAVRARLHLGEAVPQ